MEITKGLDRVGECNTSEDVNDMAAVVIAIGD